MTVETNFPLISGQISIDLVNTELVRNGIRHDLLTDPENVISWFHTLTKHNILFNEQFTSDIERWAKDALPLLREVRSYLRESYENLADGQELSSSWITHMELFIQQAPFSYQLINNELTPTPIGKPANAIVALIAFNALKLFSSNQLRNIHRCANPDCVLLFIDTRGRRKWCSMKICGNREKVTRHQQQKKKEDV
ncbi:RNA-binding protein [Salipaludibacillus neizhouensis]|uniref:RNA-binding protein n=1 Tax=Salipaludibacillus neizhouensis TaxID=885475 RepID=A0A3A9JXX6_9BACI|nr:CGNR zinc finger domain-containing protein [Salipaludibacillus neizhouensis]RKL65744.1 RNA-binding protein [Salipaludibacillus neizhouensis]